LKAIVQLMHPIDILKVDFELIKEKKNVELLDFQETYKIDQNTQMIIHAVTPKDTLPGLAIKYGVTISDLKKENKLATNNIMYSRKELLIPTTQSQLIKTLEN